ncbi:DMT family transporter [soil metagenome]|jgi:drug/metabolite transporter (DMT)-like permease
MDDAGRKADISIFGRRRNVVAALGLLVVFWGSSFAVVEVGLRSSPPMLFAGLRSLLGGLAMLGVAVVWGGRPNLRREWRAFGVLAVFNVAVFIGLQTYAISILPSGTAAVLVYLQPILVGFLAWISLGESLSVAKVAGLLLGFSGIAAVSLEGFSGSVPLVGVLFGAGSALSWAIGTVYFKRVQERVSALWSVAVPFVAGGAVLTALAAFTEPVGEVSWNSGAFLAALGWASLFGIAAAWVIFFGLVGAGEASRVSSYIFVVPITAVAIGVVFLGEPLRATLLVGAALVVGGIYLVNRSPGRKVGTGR